LITVLMTTYNCGEYISQAIKSILNQTYKNFELLIIDDGSSDNTEEIVSKISDKRIKYFKRNHVGRSASLNYGLEIASNDLIALMDADDICHPQRIELQLKNFDFKENTVLCTWSIYFNNDKLKFDIRTPVNSSEFKSKMALHSFICNSSVIFNRRLIIENGKYCEKLYNSEDYELWLRLLNISRFKVCEEYLLFPRIHKNSLSQHELSRTKNQVNFIHKKYANLDGYFGIKDVNKQSVIFGWREYFYGNKTQARKIWYALGFRLIYNPRILLAIMLTHLNDERFEWILQRRFRLLIYFKLKKFFSLKIRKAEKFLIEELAT